MTDIQCEHCGWIGDESLYAPAAPKGTADLICPACKQVTEGLEVDWKERCGHAENDLADVRSDLAAAVDRVIAANERAKVAEAEVAAWRRAVKWRRNPDEYSFTGRESWELELVQKAQPQDLGAVALGADGWRAVGGKIVHGLLDRNTACAKVCELLGIPVVLPVGGE